MLALARELQRSRPRVGGIGYGIATLDDLERVPLYPEESHLMHSLHPARRGDFWMGRAAAHRAMTALGTTPGAVLCVNRRPTFPAGVTGSLSHSGGVAVAIVASTTRFASVGIDLELRPLPANAATLVVNGEEREWVTQGAVSCAEIFCAKEAAFKALDGLRGAGPVPLRAMVLAPITGGFRVEVPQTAPLACIALHPLTTGILAWIAIRSSAPTSSLEEEQC